MKKIISDYLRTCVHDNVGETRPYIDPDSIDQMANDIAAITQSGLMNDWISVNDRLPEMTEINKYGKFSKPMLCLHTDKHHEDCILNESDDPEDQPFWSYVQDGDYCSTVTHWMPIPEPPKQ